MAAAPDIRIELAPGPWPEPELADYRLAGGRVGGRVVLRVHEPIECRGFWLDVGWHTEGRGDRDALSVHRESLLSGPLTPGELELPFDVELPPGPMSYAGELITIQWTVTATMDLAWKKDPSATRVFHVAVPTVAGGDA